LQPQRQQPTTPAQYWELAHGYCGGASESQPGAVVQVRAAANGREACKQQKINKEPQNKNPSTSNANTTGKPAPGRCKYRCGNQSVTQYFLRQIYIPFLLLFSSVTHDEVSVIED